MMVAGSDYSFKQTFTIFNKMTLHELGYNTLIHTYFQDNYPQFQAARVVVEHRERYLVRTANQEFEAEITGNMRFSAQSRADFPAVGDWVAISVFDDFAIINGLVPRQTTLERQAAGKTSEAQIIAANVDGALIVQATDTDFNPNRIERYLAICHSASIEPVVVLSKTDLISDEKRQANEQKLKERIGQVPVISLSNESLQGLEQVKAFLQTGKTFCMLGSSGAGKSTLLNKLSGEYRMSTSSVGSSTGKGRHTTTHRELFVLETGGIIIDTPGMRELGLATNSESVEDTFAKISRLSGQCRFSDCTHTSEPGCAVLKAIENEELNWSGWENYRKLKREQAHFQASVQERHARDRQFGKLQRNILEELKKRKY